MYFQVYVFSLYVFYEADPCTKELAVKATGEYIVKHRNETSNETGIFYNFKTQKTTYPKRKTSNWTLNKLDIVTSVVTLHLGIKKV